MSSSISNTLPHFDPQAKYPEFRQFDVSQLLHDATEDDAQFYLRSDQAYKRRHPGMLGAEGNLEGMISTDAANVGKVPAAMQNSLYTSGITDALGSFDSTGNAGLFDGPNAGAYAAGRSIMGKTNDFLRQQKGDVMSEINQGETIFPRRSYGFGGETATLLSTLNTHNLNNWDQAKYANDLLNEEFNYQVDASNQAAAIQARNNVSQAAAAKTAAIWGAVSDGIQTVVGAAGGMGMCWVARAAFGEHDPRWLQFRDWMLNRAPEAIREFYLQHGEKIAEEVKQSPALQFIFRSLMSAAMAT